MKKRSFLLIAISIMALLEPVNAKNFKAGLVVTPWGNKRRIQIFISRW